MSTPADNSLVTVLTFQNDANLGLLQNYSVVMATGNTKFNAFNNLPANLGQSVTYALPLRTVDTQSLDIVAQPVVQPFGTLTCNLITSVNLQVSAEQLMFFNQKEYIEQHGMDIAATMGTTVDKQCLDVAEKSPYRFFIGNIDESDGVLPANVVNPIVSYTTVDKAIVQNRNWGTNFQRMTHYIPDISQPGIIGQGLGQFVPQRNEEIANSWDIGVFSNTRHVKTNALPVHIAGAIGAANSKLTLTAISPDGTTLTFSGAPASETFAFRQYDSLYFLRSNGVYFTTNTPGLVSANPLQLRVLADAPSDVGGNVTVTVFPAIVYDPLTVAGNVNKPVTTGMFARVLPDHRCGMMVQSNAFYVAMPPLPMPSPYEYSRKTDPKTQISLLAYYGKAFDKNIYGYNYQGIFGRDLNPIYAFKIAWPVTDSFA